MRFIFASLLLFLPFLPVYAQSIEDFAADDILVAGDKLPKILLVGSFHFDYPGLDGHKTTEDNKVDVTAGKRAAEVEQLIEYIARFQPTKIVVERRSGSDINDRYRNYLAGEYELPRSEIYQLGFRLGKRFGIDTLVLGDAFQLSSSMYWGKDSTFFRPWLDEVFVDAPVGSDSTLENRYAELYEYEDKLLKNNSILDIFKHLNSPQRLRRGHGHYLELHTDVDADALAIWWYSRNLRIYHNIQKATTSPEDRILVLFGAGHMSILRQQFESSPRYELVDFGEL